MPISLKAVAKCARCNKEQEFQIDLLQSEGSLVRSHYPIPDGWTREQYTDDPMLEVLCPDHPER